MVLCGAVRCGEGRDGDGGGATGMYVWEWLVRRGRFP